MGLLTKAMAQKKAHEVEGWLRRPDATPIVLLYGPDHGLVAERARAYAASTGLPLDDPFTVVRMGADEADETGRLIDEARTVSMFAGRRLIWVRGAAGQKRLADDVKALGEAPPEETTILIEAGDLKKGAGLRAACEASRNAIALPCYADGARELDALIGGILGEARLTISLGARAALKENLGGDRLASRGEIEKLALYCWGKGAVELQDVTDLAGDVAELSMDEVIDATATGVLDELDRQLRRYLTAGGQPALLLSSAIRHFQMLRLLASDVTRNQRSATAAIEAHRPPVHFSRKRNVETALRAWTPRTVDDALTRLFKALLETRRRADLDDAVASRALIGLCVEAGRALR